MTATRPLVLVTRPAQEAERTAAVLARHGYDTLIEPLIAIEPVPGAAALLGDLAGVAALLFTSVNGVRTFALANTRRDLPAFAVGPTTAEAARNAGFASVKTAAGDVSALASLVAAECRPDRGALLHAAGEAVAGDLAGRLRDAGYDFRRVALYRAVPAASLSARARDTLAHGRLAAALFFSPRTAQTFVTLARTAGLGAECRAIVAVCLSQAVADAIGTLAWRRVALAATSSQEAAVEALREAVPANGGPAGQTERSTMAEDESSKASESPAPGEPLPAAPAIALGASEVIARFGGIRPMASKMGISFSTVQGWKERNQIPANRHAEIQALADKLGISLAPGDTAAAATTAPAGSEPSHAATPSPPPPKATAMEQEKPPPLPPPLPPQTVPQPSPGLGVAGAAMVSIVVVALGLAAAYVARPYWQTAPAVQATLADTGELSQRLAKLEKDMAVRPAPPAPDPKVAQDLSALAKKTADLEAALQKRSSDLESALAAAKRDADAQLAASKRDSAQAVAAAADQAKALVVRVEALEKGFDPQGFVALRNGLNDLGGRIDALGKRLDQAEKAAAAARAQGLADAALALAVAQLRRAVDSGQAYSAELATCRSLAGADAKVKSWLDALTPAAGSGIATRAALADEFPDTAAAIARAALQRGETGWLRTVIDRLDSLVTIRPVGASVAGETPRARAARAEALLARNDLAGAIGLLGGLEGRPAEAAKPWLDRARARLAAEAALASLETQATAHLAAKPGAAQ